MCCKERQLVDLKFEEKLEIVRAAYTRRPDQFLCYDQIVDLAGNSFPYLRLKFRWAWMSDFVFKNEVTHLALMCEVRIFTNTTFPAKFTRFCLITK